MLIVGGDDVRSLLDGREDDVIDRVEEAYRAHARGDSSVPHSLFLRFPDAPRNRIIALPAYLRTPERIAGVKWVSSFPGNVEQGRERASAVLVLNSADTGVPEAIVEASVINARRTAASAAAAARVLAPDAGPDAVALIGCGPINFEIVRFLLATRPGLRRLTLFDLDPMRAERFGARCVERWPSLAARVAGGVAEALDGQSLVSIATTAPAPHLADLSPCAAGAVVLHVSLRDIAPEVLLACDNVTDDVDHVCRADTSLDLAARRTGSRDFIRTTIGEILTGAAPARAGDGTMAVFSPFGLGILDIAVADLVRRLALAEGRGMVLGGFFPT